MVTDTDIDVAVVIAYRDMGCPYRRRSAAYVHGWYVGHAANWHLDLGWRTEVHVEAGTDDDTFTRASAINAAIRATTATVIVQSDPDSLVNATTLRQAIRLAANADGLVIPHDRYLYLTDRATKSLYMGRTSFGPDDCEFHGNDGSGNVVVFSQSTWVRAGGYDERFGIWGGDDAAFRYAADAFTAPTRRLFGDMLHLYHPRLPQSNPGHPGYRAQFAILAQYRDAAAVGPDEVRRLVGTR